MTKSNEATIGQMNESIANFMGAKINGHWVEIPHRRYGLGSRHYPSQLKYHIGWDWLMPVWYKFVDLLFEDPMHQLKHSELKTTVGYAILYGDIALAHTNLFEAIQWYNNQTTNE